MPLDEHIEGGHGERQQSVEIVPYTVHDPLAMADHGQHGQHRLHQQAVLPLPALAEFQVGRIALRGMESGITQRLSENLTAPSCIYQAASLW